jgi:hypothetical protein
MTIELRGRLERLSTSVSESADALDDLRRRRARRARRRRIGAAAIATIVVSSTTFALMQAFEQDGRRERVNSEPILLAETYTDALGWSIDYPRGWYMLPIDWFDGRVELAGAAFSNEPLSPADDEGFGGSPLPDLSTLTHEGAVLIITHRSGGPAPTFDDDSEFPLDPADAQFIPGPLPASAVLDFRGDGLGDFTARFGGYADAPPALYDALDRMIRSIRFQPWEPGDVRNGFAAISSDVSEGRGEVNWVARLQLIYVMKFDGREYVIDVPDVSCEGQNQTWDPVAEQILLEGPCYSDIRYDKDGIPDPSNPLGYRDPLDKHPIVHAWDGETLVALETTYDW